MQEEVENRTLTLVVSGTKFTGRLMKAAITKYLAHRKEKKLQKQKSRDTPVIPHGKQTVKQLIGQNQGVSNIEITDPSIKEFEKIARKYGVDYAVKKDRSSSPPKYLVFFKAKDVDVMTAAFKEYTSETLKKQKRESVRQKLEKVKEEQMEGLMAIYTSKLWLRHIQLSNAKTTISSLKFQSVQLMRQLDVRFKYQQYMAMLN